MNVGPAERPGGVEKDNQGDDDRDHADQGQIEINNVGALSDGEKRPRVGDHAALPVDLVRDLLPLLPNLPEVFDQVDFAPDDDLAGGEIVGDREENVALLQVEEISRPVLVDFDRRQTALFHGPDDAVGGFLVNDLAVNVENPQNDEDRQGDEKPDLPVFHGAIQKIESIVPDSIEAGRSRVIGLVQNMPAGGPGGPGDRRLAHQPFEGFVHLDAERLGVLRQERTHVVGGRPPGGVRLLRRILSRRRRLSEPDRRRQEKGGRENPF